MDEPSAAPTRLFHLHFNAPDVAGLERWFESVGVPLRRRFGVVRGEGVSLAPDEDAPDDWRFRLQSHRVGAVDVTLAPGQRHHFDHLGLVAARFDDVVAAAEDAGWSVRDPDGRRPFVMTPWGFRVEVHREGSDVARSLGSPSVARFERVELRVPEDRIEAVRDGLREVFGDVPALDAVAAAVDRPTVRRFELGGEQFDATTPLEVPE